jgi:hypothetical protein
MTAKAELPHITGFTLKIGELNNIFPEVIPLKQCRENSPWHNNLSVFDHTVSTLNNIGKEIKFASPEIKDYLNQKVDKKYTRLDLSLLVGLLHDVGKPVSIKTDSKGNTTCLHHEDIGASYATRILKRFDLSSIERDFVTTMVLNHGLLHQTTNSDNLATKEEFFNLDRLFPYLSKDLIILAKADTAGSDLKTLNPSDYQRRINFYNMFL